MSWCPHSFIPFKRLGVLAVCQGDGSLAIYSIPIYTEGDGSILDIAPFCHYFYDGFTPISLKWVEFEGKFLLCVGSSEGITINFNIRFFR